MIDFIVTKTIQVKATSIDEAILNHMTKGEVTNISVQKKMGVSSPTFPVIAPLPKTASKKQS